MHRIGRLGRIAPVALFLFACGGSDSATTPTPSATTIEIIGPSDPLLLTEVGESVALQARVLDQSGAVMPDQTVTWTSTSPTIVTVDASGLVVAASQGEASVRAQSSGVTASIAVVVDTPDTPVAMLAAPADSSQFLSGAKIVFRGSVEDSDAGEAEQAVVTWVSDLLGELGTGLEVERLDLTAGEHQISMIATDPTGRTDTASVALSVREPAPDAEVTSGSVSLPEGLPTDGLSLASVSGVSSVAADGSYAVEVLPSATLSPMLLRTRSGEVALAVTVGGSAGIQPVEVSPYQSAVSLMTEQLRGVADDSELEQFFELVSEHSATQSVAAEIEAVLAEGSTLEAELERVMAAVGAVMGEIVTITDAADGAPPAAGVASLVGADSGLSITVSDGGVVTLRSKRVSHYAVSVFDDNRAATGWSASGVNPVVANAVTVPRGDWGFGLDFGASGVSLEREFGDPIQVFVPEVGTDQRGFSVVVRSGNNPTTYGIDASSAARTMDDAGVLAALPIPHSCLEPVATTFRRVLPEFDLTVLEFAFADEATQKQVMDRVKVALDESGAGSSAGFNCAQSLAENFLSELLEFVLKYARLGSTVITEELLQNDREASSGVDLCVAPNSDGNFREGECLILTSLNDGSTSTDNQTGTVSEPLGSPLRFGARGALSSDAYSGGSVILELDPAQAEFAGGLGSAAQGDFGPVFTAATLAEGLTDYVYWAPRARGENNLEVKLFGGGFVYDELELNATGTTPVDGFLGDWYTAGPVSFVFDSYCGSGDAFTETSFALTYSDWTFRLRSAPGSTTSADWGQTRTTTTSTACGVSTGTNTWQIGYTTFVLDETGSLNGFSSGGDLRYTVRVISESELEVTYLRSWQGTQVFRMTRVPGS